MNHINGDPRHIEEIVAAAKIAASEGLSLNSVVELNGTATDAGSRHHVQAANDTRIQLLGHLLRDRERKSIESKL